MNDAGDVRQPDDELAWRAFRYAAGELTADEARDLEEQMVGNPAVCEAVARAVMLCGELAAARPEVAPNATVGERPTLPMRRRWSAAEWLSIAAAACVAFAAGGYLFHRDDVVMPPAAQPDRVAMRLVSATQAVAWLQLRDLDRTADRNEPAWDEWESDDLPSVDFESGRGPAVPAWLVDLATATNKKGNP